MGSFRATSVSAQVGSPRPAAAGITFIAPPGAQTDSDQSEGPAGYTEGPVAFRATDTRPTIGIQADGGTALQCHFDDVFMTQARGGPEPGCAAVCGSFQPAAPLGADSDEFTRSHFLAVDLVDANGDPVASVWVNVDVDTTPPVTQLETAGGALTTPDNGSFTPARLPARHRLYRLQVRATDDFGARRRPPASMTPVLGEYRASSPTSTFTVSRHLHLSGAARQALRQARSVGIVIAAGDPDKIDAQIGDDSLSYQALTLRR